MFLSFKRTKWEKKKSILKFQIEEVPCCSSSWDFVLSFDWVQVQSGKLIAYKPRGAAKKERNREREKNKKKERNLTNMFHIVMKYL